MSSKSLQVRIYLQVRIDFARGVLSKKSEK